MKNLLRMQDPEDLFFLVGNREWVEEPVNTGTYYEFTDHKCNLDYMFCTCNDGICKHLVAALIAESMHSMH